MDLTVWAFVFSLVMGIDHPNSSATWLGYSNRVILLVELWAHAHDKSILWVTDR
ncbi:MAG: hypothetical protein JNJ77_03725 [Planctomycetia bacterium]|nr:hypothetical protein [Planctomycetia bacterium]